MQRARQYFRHLSGIAVLGALGLVAFAAEEEPAPPAPQAPVSSPRVAIEPRPRPGSEPARESRAPNIRIDANLVLVNVTVTTPLNQVVTGMDREHFRLFEDKTEQEIISFSIEEAPLSICLVFDVSGSMGSKLAKARQAASEFFNRANPEDDFCLVQFSDSPKLVVPWTRDTGDILNRMAFTEARGRTSLLDGLYLAMNEMKKANNPRKAILILSDGGDNNSRYTQSEIKNRVREADVQIYGMGIFEPIGGRSRTPEELSGPSLLRDVSEETGGRSFHVDNLNDLPDIAAKIGIELRSQYILGYSPTNDTKDGKYRRIEVKLVQPRGMPQLRAYYRTGRYAPTQ